MLALRERERRFVWAYLLNALTDGKENGAQAARDAGYSDSSGAAKVTAHHLLHREEILDAMGEVATRELRGLAVPAVVALGQLVRKPEHPDHRKAIEMVLNRTGQHERTQVDVNFGGEVTVNHTDAAVDDLKRYLDLCVPREKLVEIFGFSGLTRYEKMLAEREGRALPAPAVIDGEARRVE